MESQGAVQPPNPGLRLHGEPGVRRGDELRAPGGKILAGGKREVGISVANQPKPEVGPRQGETNHGVPHVVVFHGSGSHKFPPGGHIVEEPADFDEGPFGKGFGTSGVHLPSSAAHSGPFARSPGTRRDRNLGDRSDAVEGLSAKPQGFDPSQILQFREFARRVFNEEQGQIVGRDPHSVVADGDAGESALVHLDVHAARPGVDGVLDQFLDHGSGPLDDLPRGDLRRDVRSQDPDPVHPQSISDRSVRQKVPPRQGSGSWAP